MRWLSFWKRSAGRGLLWLWHDVVGHLERLLLVLVVVAGLSLGLVLVEQPIRIAVAVGAGLVIAVLGQGAYFEWREADVELRPFKERRPLEAIAESSRVRGEEWLNISVSNPNAVPVADCYAKITRYGVRAEGDPDPPRPGHKLPWRSWGGPRRLVANIPAKSVDYVDLATARETEPDVFYTPTVSDNDVLPVRLSFPLPRGIYEVVIEIGSERDIIPVRVIRATIEFAGRMHLRCRLEELS